MPEPQESIPAARELTGPSRPWRLLELPEPPSRVFVHGTLPRGPAVAIVGTRSPSHEAEAYARELAHDLASSGVAVLSGGATGIDAAAHMGALEAGGTTVVVAPAGLERPYPEAHAGLFRRILRERGAYISACEPRAPAELNSFFGRNAMLAALADAVVIVEAPVRSGARNAAQHARRLSRPLFVVPAPPWNPRGLGCILELKLGARPLFSARDVLAAFHEQRLHPVGNAAAPSEGQLAGGARESRPPPRKTRRAAPRGGAGQQLALLSELDSSAGLLAGEAARVRLAIEHGACCVDHVCERSGLELRRVQHVLAVLVSAGLVQMELDGGLRLATEGTG